MSQAVNFETLQSISGYTKPYDVMRWADKHGIKYFKGKIGICTTQEALNTALGINSDSSQYSVESVL